MELCTFQCTWPRQVTKPRESQLDVSLSQMERDKSPRKMEIKCPLHLFISKSFRGRRVCWYPRAELFLRKLSVQWIANCRRLGSLSQQVSVVSYQSSLKKQASPWESVTLAQCVIYFLIWPGRLFLKLPPNDSDFMWALLEHNSSWFISLPFIVLGKTSRLGRSLYLNF